MSCDDCENNKNKEQEKMKVDTEWKLDKGLRVTDLIALVTFTTMLIGSYTILDKRLSVIEATVPLTTQAIVQTMDDIKYQVREMNGKLDDLQRNKPAK